mmetsp:Transcript_27575/g.53577  ORF Transcript_27575/g.53577 Transcript_27575/m.53577 type:complete len:214 (-) Transcript_27575:575-1216(-)
MRSRSAEGWIISDGIKLAIVFAMLVATLLQLREKSEKLQYLLHRWNAVLLVLMLVFFANMHGEAGMTWYTFLFLSSIIVEMLAMAALYICKSVTMAQYVSNNLEEKIPSWFHQSFNALAVLSAVSQAVGSALTAATNDYRYSLFRHLATTILVVSVTGLTSYHVINLKIMLRALTRQTQILHMDEEGSSPLVSDDVIQQRLTRILFISIPIGL